MLYFLAQEKNNSKANDMVIIFFIFRNYKYQNSEYRCCQAELVEGGATLKALCLSKTRLRQAQPDSKII